MKIRKNGASSFLSLITSVAENYVLPVDVVSEILSQTFKKAFLKEYPDNVIEVDIDLDNGKIEIWRQLKVVTDDFYRKSGFEDDETLVPVSQLKSLPKCPRNVASPKVGDLVYREIDLGDFDVKVTANIQLFFKKLIQQEVSRTICGNWTPLLGKVIEGTVDEIIENRENRTVKKVIVSLVSPDGTAAKGIIFRGDLVWVEGPNGTRIYENLVLGNSYLFYVKDVSEINLNFPITLSRTDAEIVKYLMEKHISEMADGQVEVRAIARIAGLKTKVLVYSKNPNIDPVGCCIGPKGKRLKVISQELLNEKIDVILWNEDPVQNIINSFVTGKILGYRLEDDNQITLIATLDNLLSCIGRRGSNTKLVHMLTNWKINLKTIQEAKEENLDYIAIDDDKFVSSNKISERIFKMHYKKSDDILAEYYSERNIVGDE